MAEMGLVGFVGMFFSGLFLSQAYSVYWAIYIALSAVMNQQFEQSTSDITWIGELFIFIWIYLRGFVVTSPPKFMFEQSEIGFYRSISDLALVDVALSWFAKLVTQTFKSHWTFYG